MPAYMGGVRRGSDIFGGPVQATKYDPNRRDPARSSIPGGVFGGGGDFLDRLAIVEARESERSERANTASSRSSNGPINEHNWAQRSKAIGALATKNEEANRMARERSRRGESGPSPQQLKMAQQQEMMQRGQMQQQQMMEQQQQQQQHNHHQKQMALERQRHQQAMAQRQQQQQAMQQQ